MHKTGPWRKYEAHAQHGQGHSLETVCWIASSEPSDRPPESQLLRTFDQRQDIYKTVLSEFSGFIIATADATSRALEPVQSTPLYNFLSFLRLPQLQPNLCSASFASIFICQLSYNFSFPFTHAAVNLQPPSRTVLYQTVMFRTSAF